MDKLNTNFHQNNLTITGTSEDDMNIGTVAPSIPQRRKILKPLMEKRRRARINASLAELKTFLLDMIKREGLRPNKMEKADILELTVKQLRQLQKQGYKAEADESFGNDTFVKGFCACASKVSSFLNSMPEVDISLQTRLTDHLLGCNDAENTDVTTTNMPSKIYSNKPNEPKKSDIDQMRRLTDRDLEYNKPIPLDGETSEKQIKFVPNSSTNVSQPLGMFGIFQKVTDQKANPCVDQIQTVDWNSCVQVGSTHNALCLVPAQLPSGETVYIVPSNGVANSSFPNIVLSMLTFTHPVQSDVYSIEGPLNNMRKAPNACLSSCETSEQMLQNELIRSRNKDDLDQSRANADGTFIGLRNMSNVSSADKSNSPGYSTFDRELQGPVWRPW